ncbi:MAG: isochorismatase family protein [Phycisphaerae bacterium]
MIRIDRLDADRSAVLVIDLQEKLLPAIQGADRILAATTCLLKGAREFGMPIVATEQYVKGLGPTQTDIRSLFSSFNATVIEKPTFSACGYEPIRNAIREVGRTQWLVVGIEAHICVLQTALDLATLDYQTYICADGVGSRATIDCEVALDRMRQEGMTVGTVESCLYEVCDRCDSEQFKALLPHVKEKSNVS